MIRLKYFTNEGAEIIITVQTVEQAILKFRAAKKKKIGANFGKYSIDGNVWFKI